MGGLSRLHIWWSKDRREQLKACPVTTLVKKCTRCRIPQPRSEFYVNNKLISGLSSMCKKCTRESNNKRYKDQKGE